jgi:ElaB/YqjD/DUF883 family membrane-anchored ribosome-binding protein
MEQTTAQTDKTTTNVRELQTRAEDMLQTAGRRWNDTMQQVSVRAKEAARIGEEQIQQKPWTSMGIGFGAGVVIGALLMLAAAPRR